MSNVASASDDLWILGIHMTKFGKHPEMDLVDLASEAVTGALADGGMPSFKDALSKNGVAAIRAYVLSQAHALWDAKKSKPSAH